MFTTKKYIKIITILAAFTLILSAAIPGIAAAAEYPCDIKEWESVEGDYTGKTVILHSNDVHGAIAGYAYMAELKKEFTDKGAEVILADAGDFSQGTVYVDDSKGEDAVSLMNEVGYDIATIGNHEFNYGFDILENNLAKAEFKVICANILKDGKLIHDPDYIFETKSGIKIGFFGMATPETLTKSSPWTTKDLEFIYNTGNKTQLFTCAEEQIDDLKNKGADIIIALSHLGVDAEAGNMSHRSIDMYKNVTGIDMIIDGHSHTSMTKGGENEPIQQTGTNFDNIGVIVIDNSSKKIESNYLISTKNLKKDQKTQEIAQTIIEKTEAKYSEAFAKSEVLLEGDNRICRTKETNLGDLATDAIVWKILGNDSSLKVEKDHVVGILNGGSFRAGINIGDITEKDIKTTFPFSNTVSVVYITGDKLLEILEASTANTPEEMGGYPQTRGISFTLDTTKEYKAGEEYENTTVYSPASINRISITSVNGREFNPEDTYAVVTNDFLASGGDTYYVLSQASDQYNTGLTLDSVLIEYINNELNGIVSAEKYGKTRGDQTIITTSPKETDKPAATDKPNAIKSPDSTIQPAPGSPTAAPGTTATSQVSASATATPGTSQSESAKAGNKCTKIKCSSKAFKVKKGVVKIIFKITTAKKGKKTTDKIKIVFSKRKIVKIAGKKLTAKKLIVSIKKITKGKTKMTVNAGAAKATVKITAA